MTNGDKYLKDGVDVEEIVSAYRSWYIEDKMMLELERKILVEKENELRKFLNKEVKPMLTEDEKVILSHINTDIYAKIGRYKNGEIIFRNVNDSYIVLTPYFKFENMFQFIKPRRRI